VDLHLFVVHGVCACTVRHVILCLFVVDKEKWPMGLEFMKNS
jgi:hypothetical protein